MFQPYFTLHQQIIKSSNANLHMACTIYGIYCTCHMQICITTFNNLLMEGQVRLEKFRGFYFILLIGVKQLLSILSCLITILKFFYTSLFLLIGSFKQ